MTRKYTNNWMQEEAKLFWTKIWWPREYKKAKWISNVAKELEGIKKGQKAKIHIDLLWMTQKNYQIGKRQAMMEYMDSGSRNSPPFMIDQHSK